MHAKIEAVKYAQNNCIVSVEVVRNVKKKGALNQRKK